MDFSKVKIIEKPNPRKPEVVKEKKPTFHLKVDYTKQRMTFSSVLFDQLQLEHNSLAQGIGPDNELLLLVMPGNAGMFAKSQAKGAKGHSFKNIKFVQDLQNRNWLGGKFNLDFVGEHESILYYSVVPFGDAEAAAEPAEEQPEEQEPEISEEEVQFN